jgi:hypothetical protein
MPPGARCARGGIVHLPRTVVRSCRRGVVSAVTPERRSFQPPPSAAPGLATTPWRAASLPGRVERGQQAGAPERGRAGRWQGGRLAYASLRSSSTGEVQAAPGPWRAPPAGRRRSQARWSAAGQGAGRVAFASRKSILSQKGRQPPPPLGGRRWLAGASVRFVEIIIDWGKGQTAAGRRAGARLVVPQRAMKQPARGY